MIPRTTISGALAAAALWCGSAEASLIPLDLLPTPDIFIRFSALTYDAGSDLRTVTGAALTLDQGAGGVNIINGTFDLQAAIGLGGLIGLGGGAITITGEVGVFGPGVLLQGDLIDFGFLDSPGGELFEFLFEVTGGDLAIGGLYGVPGPTSQFGVILDAVDSNFDGTFDVDFANSGGGFADVRAVPGPASFALLMLGAGALGRRKRRRLV